MKKTDTFGYIVVHLTLITLRPKYTAFKQSATYHIYFSETESNELKFHMKTPYDRFAKRFTKFYGHMTKMTAMPIYGKGPLKIFFSRNRRPVTQGLGM